MATTRFIDWLRNLTTKTSTTLDGTEQIHIDSSGLSQKANTKNIVSYTIRNLEQDWSSSGLGSGTPAPILTGLKFNASGTDASNTASLLMDLQVGGSSKFKVRKEGSIDSWGIKEDSYFTYIKGGAVPTSTDFNVVFGGAISFGMNETSTNLLWVNPITYAISLALYRDAANILAQRNSINPQTFRLYRNYIDSANVAYTALTQDSTTGFILNSVNSGSNTNITIPTNLLDVKLNGSSKVIIDKDGFASASGYKITSAGISTETSNTKILSESDNGKILYFTSNTAITVNTASSLSVGFSCSVVQANTGQITFVQGTGTTMNSFGNLVKTSGQYAMATVISPATNTFILLGNLV